MTIYIKYWANGTIELIYIKTGWRKKRYHFLINPQDVAQIISPQGEINYESVTHIIALETPFASEDFYEKVVEISEWLNKPIITSQESFPELRKRGVPVSQLRSIETLEEIFQEIDLVPVRYTKARFDPKNERVKPTEQANSQVFVDEILPETVVGFVGLALRPFQLLTKFFFSAFKRQINPLTILPLTKTKRRERKTNNHQIPERHIFLDCLINRIRVLIPLDSVGKENLPKAILQINPDIVISWDLNLSELFSFPEGPHKLILLDSSYFKEEPTFIPRTFNKHLPFDVILSGKNQWVELT
ncbi:MAG: hypothetical protein D6732_01115 [Methanobacteriota archaeon]|nr:MAG: hypothetical protein D6732_01115 [Euryarchaeota archaeon]